MFTKKGQSTIEYLIIVAIVISICLITIPKVIKQYKKSLLETTKQMRVISKRLKNSR